MAKLSDLTKNQSSQNLYISAPVSKTKELVDGKEAEVLRITGLVEGVTLSGYSAEDTQYGRAVLFTFTDAEGATTRKYVNEPQDLDSDAGKGILNSVYNLYEYFFGNVDQKMVDEKGDEREFNTVEELADILFSDAVLPSPKTGKIKMVFANASGQYPKYKIPNYNWYGDKIYFSKKEKGVDENSNLDETKGQLYFVKTVPSDSEATMSSEGAEQSAPTLVKDNSLF